MGNTIPISFSLTDRKHYLYEPYFPAETSSWIWLEVYQDKRKEYVIIPEYFILDNGEIKKRSFRDIKQNELLQFQMLHSSGKFFRFNISQEDNFRLIHFYRNIQTFDMMSGKMLETIKYPVQGYQKTVNGRNVKVLIKFFPNGSFEITDLE